MSHDRRYRWTVLLALFGLVIATFALPGAPRVVHASDTPTPVSVTIAGSFQSELGCPGDWQPECTVTRLVYDAADQVWQATFTIPAGNWEYKAALNGSWDENYGANAQRNGSNIALSLSSSSPVRFYYDHETHWVTSNRNTRIVTAPGDYQSELGCPGDWQPDCLRSWLQDPDGDGTFSATVTGLPAGNYQFKIAIDESWSENYGAGGIPGGANIPFSVPAPGYRVTFRFVSATNTPSVTVVSSGAQPDNNVEWDGVRHDSRNPLYRTPGGAVPAGTPVTIRLRTFHNDVTSVRLRVYDLNASAQRFYDMAPAATDVACYQAGLDDKTCDFWEVTLNEASPNNLWYRFIVTDGSDTDYYDDDTPALDGGLGGMTDDQEDHSWALMFYDPAFTVPEWAKDAVIYQIFPDRFRNGNPRNDPHTGDSRYDDPVIALPWGELPEGYCRNYSDAAANCPWRFDDTPPSWSPTKESPRGRDYYGGDLRGVISRLDYLKNLGVTVIYFNPIFHAKSNHRYDTYDYFSIDPALGTLADFRRLVREAERRGIRVIVDSVFNHMSSDSPQFDRYGYYATLGACESAASPYRDWFRFRRPGPGEPSPCAPSTPGGDDTYYVGWFGFDSIPEIRKENPAVLNYFVTGPNSVSRYWLHQGASGWRLDVMGDASFPPDYWTTFRTVVRETRHDALIIGELWQKDSTLLRHLRGDTADTTMNYRLRDAIIGLLTPGPFDSKGFADSGRQITPSEFANRISSIREDYPDAAYLTLMNLVGSHDTERILWTLTPGAETRADKEFNAANLANGKQRLRIASLIQFTMPGAPTIYYGDEVGVTGDDDPDDRRTYPWAETGGNPDRSLLRHYSDLARIRHHYRSLHAGDLRFLLADDAAGTVAYARISGDDAAIVAINRSSQSRTVDIPVAGVIPDGTAFFPSYCVANDQLKDWLNVQNGTVRVTLNPMSAVLLTSYLADLTPPPVPTSLQVTGEGDGQVSLAWNSVPGAAGYNLYRSPLSGGGFVKVNNAPLSATTYTDAGLRNARDYFYVVTSLDEKGNESAFSNEVQAMPRLQIGWANLQWPPSITHTISTINRTPLIFGQVWIDGVTNRPGPTEGLRAQLGYGPRDSNPAGNPAWIWIEAEFNVDAGNNDEFKASLLPDQIGLFDYAYRYSTTNGREWTYADLDGISNGYSPSQAGKLTVVASSDTTPPATPTGLTVVTASPAGITLRWNAVTGDPTLYGYEVRRSSVAGGPYTTIATVTGVEYTDTTITQGATYYYVVRAVDTSFNRSAHSAEVAATAELRTVSVTFTVTVPSTTPAGSTVYIAGFLDRLDGNLPQWNPGGVALTQTGPNQWSITLTGKETTQIEYKYTLGSWDYVEKGTACDEIANRQLTLTYGVSGVQIVNDSVANWRNVAPCGN